MYHHLTVLLAYQRYGTGSASIHRITQCSSTRTTQAKSPLCTCVKWCLRCTVRDELSSPKLPQILLYQSSGLFWGFWQPLVRGLSFGSFAPLTKHVDTISSFTTLVGVLRAGYLTFPISTRNSVLAVVHLLTKADIDYVVVGPEAQYQKLAQEAFRLLKEQGRHVPNALVMPQFDELYGDESFEPLPSVHPDMLAPSLYMHSSGMPVCDLTLLYAHSACSRLYRLSETYPVAVLPSSYDGHYSMYAMNFLIIFLSISLTPISAVFGERDMTGTKIAIHSLPMYHGMGVIMTGWAVSI